MSILLSSLMSLSVYAAGLEDFVGRPLMVEPQSTQRDSFMDVFSPFNAAGEADSMAPSPHNFGYLGICLQRDQSPCVREFDSHSAIYEAFYQSIGQRQLIGELNLSGVPDGNLRSESRWSVIGSELKVTTVKTLGNRRFRGEYILRKEGLLSERQVRMHFPRTSRSERSSWSEQPRRFQELSAAVVQIENGPLDPQNLLGRIVKSGTGFFISSDGLLLTNHHVIASYPGCLKKLRCQLTIRRYLDVENQKSFQVQAQIYARNEGYDFALLKIELPFVTSVLEIEPKQIGDKLVTLGFPGDRLMAGGDIDLTYSIGHLTGFKSRSFATSVFAYPGASGSPLLNERNSKVVGIISDVHGRPEKGSGNPSISRPIDIIDSKYGIREYVSGEKQKRMDRIVSDLNETESEASARKLLRRYANENSLYRVDRLLELLVYHRSKEVRMQIFNTLQDLELILGQM